MEQLKICLHNVPAEWEFGTAELLPELELAIDAAGYTVTVARGKGLSVVPTATGAAITAERACAYFRALSHLRTVLASGKAVRETARADSLGLMEDMSRNAVMHVAGVKRLIRTLALMGYNALQLYTEDTYELEGYPYFGHLRGRYTVAELKEIDDYAYALGIEVVPCIQTLAHLNQALQQSAFKAVQDTGDILLVGAEETNRMIEAMIATMASTFRSRRINIGMDEAHMLGRGKYLDRNGYRPAHEIMLEHLGFVVGLCKKYGLSPMMWSDMFFRMAFGGKYYVKEGDIPAEVAAKIPRDVTLVYWDYYTADRDAFTHMLHCHTALEGVPVAFAGGAWRWGDFVPANRFSIQRGTMHLAECFAKGIRDITVTSWGDNGNESAHFSTLPTLLHVAETVYGASAPDAAQLDTRARACFDIGFEELLTLDAPNELPGIEVGRFNPYNVSKVLLYNDPLLGLLDCHVDPATAADAYRAAEARLRVYAHHPKLGYMFENLANLSALLTDKCDFSYRLREAYRAGDRAVLQALADKVPAMVAALDRFHISHRRQWNQESKPFGFEVQEQRLGGLRARLLSTADRIAVYLAGEVDEIPELTVDPLPYKECPAGETYLGVSRWSYMVSPAIV